MDELGGGGVQVPTNAPLVDLVCTATLQAFVLLGFFTGIRATKKALDDQNSEWSENLSDPVFATCVSVEPPAPQREYSSGLTKQR